jgi:ferric-dicitrate binding protein FerR (iron transport regulator)
MQIITRAARFNVTSRADETAPVVSLISGTATVQTDDANPVSPVSITAGQQIEWISGKLQTGSMKNPGDVIAWKNNRTSFHDAGIKTIMLEVARWYDVDVEYSGTIPDLKYSITISRDAKIEDLLVLLRKQGGHFTLHRRTIHVSY